jgi:tRNA threonylcarbamoyladenosine biosynthesis protein TsaB
MRTLAIETATTACAIALEVDGVVLERVLDHQRRHTEALTAGIAEALSELTIAARDLERIVVDRGPGLFTGLRVGLAAAQSLARGLGVELVEFTSLEALAHGAFVEGVRGTLVAMVDARRGEVFAQRFVLSDVAVATDDARVVRPQELVTALATSGEVLTVTGDGARRYDELLALVPSVTRHDQSVPSARAAIELTRNRASVEHVSPLYLREADAVANFTLRTGS